MQPETLNRIERLAGQAVTGHESVIGGYTPAERWLVRFADGSSAFAKIGATPLTARFLRAEHRVYEALRGDWMAAYLGFDDHERPILLLEDLSGAHWPPPWQPDQIERVRAALAAMARTPLDVPPLSRAELTGWSQIAADPEPFLSVGMCSAAWLDRALPTLVEAERSTALEGDDLLHLDVRSDNLCLLPDRVVLVDWNHACRGPAALDEAFWAPTLRLEGGPLPDALGCDDYAAVVAGYFAAHAGLPQIPDAPRVRWIQRRQLRIALPWACRALGLPAPDLRWARNATAGLDPSAPTWQADFEEILVDAYLGTADPRAGSGKSGDEVEWRWSRELLLDALVGERAAILDVGAANGYLVESLERWGRERGLELALWGLEISARLACVARARLPHLANRLLVGDVIDWVPPRRFDLVHTGLDYVRPGEERALIERIRRDLLAPGGRIVIRAERAGEDDPVAQLRRIGIEPDGILEAVHPTTGVVRRTAWLSRIEPTRAGAAAPG